MVPHTTSASTSVSKKREIISEDRIRQCLQDLTIPHICYALLSTLLVQCVCGNPVPADVVATMRVSELPFSERLSNPCSLVDATRLQSGTFNHENRNAARQTVINEMKAKASLLKENAETILRTNVVKVCPTLDLPSVAIIPSEDDISDSTPLNALRLFYTSLLNHTAYVYFITEQQKRHEVESSCNSPDLSANARSLASDMRELMCVLRLCTLTLQEEDDENDTFEDSTDQILNEELEDQPLCSRRSVRDCQTIRSTVDLLRKLFNYLQTTVLFSTSSDSAS